MSQKRREYHLRPTPENEGFVIAQQYNGIKLEPHWIHVVEVLDEPDREVVIEKIVEALKEETRHHGLYGSDVDCKSCEALAAWEKLK
jgi:hypothetical protein